MLFYVLFSHSQILGFIYITLSIFSFDGVTAKTNSVSSSRLVFGFPLFGQRIVKLIVVLASVVKPYCSIEKRFEQNVVSLATVFSIADTKKGCEGD